MIRGNETFLTRLYYVVDVCIITLSFLFVWRIEFDTLILHDIVGHLPFTTYLVSMFPYLFSMIICSWLMDLNGLKRKRSIRTEIFKICQVHFISMGILLGILFLLELNHISRSFLFLFLMTNILVVSLVRVTIKLILTELRKKGYNKQFILILGAGTIGRKYHNNILNKKEYGIEVIGFLDDFQNQHRSEYSSFKPILGKISELEDVISHYLIDEIVVALPLHVHHKYDEIIHVCEKSGIRVSIVPDFHELLPAKPNIELIGDMAVINIRNIPLNQFSNQFFKRLLDVVLTVFFMIIASPIFLIIPLLIKLTSKGPIIYKQERIGMNRRPFNMYKFRSMKSPDSQQEELQWTIPNDKRRTKIGAFLRATSIDELPQLFNVLKGDMSLVGPRPERPHFVDQFKEDIPNYMVKHQVRPGITGWAQVNGYRGDTSIIKRVNLDLFYIENWTFVFDVKIIVKTIFKGLINKNAY